MWLGGCSQADRARIREHQGRAELAVPRVRLRVVRRGDRPPPGVIGLHPEAPAGVVRRQSDGDHRSPLAAASTSARRVGRRPEPRGGGQCSRTLSQERMIRKRPAKPSLPCRRGATGRGEDPRRHRVRPQVGAHGASPCGAPALGQYPSRQPLGQEPVDDRPCCALLSAHRRYPGCGLTLVSGGKRGHDRGPARASSIKLRSGPARISGLSHPHVASR